MNDRVDVDEVSSMNWRAAPGYEGWYEVSDEGAVRRIKPASRTFNGRIRTPTLNPSGYPTVRLPDPNTGLYKSIQVHRLVAAAFLGPRPEGMDINHKDGKKTNNKDGNLEYCSRRQNIQHAWRTGLQHVRLGESNHNAKLSSDQIRLIRATVGQTALVAKEFGVSGTLIRLIRRGLHRSKE